MPAPIFNLHEIIEATENVDDILYRTSLTNTVKYLLGNQYDYFSECIAVVDEVRYSTTSNSYLFFPQDIQNNNTSSAYLEINDMGEVYIGLHYGMVTYYYTNNPDKNSELHFDYLYSWFNLHGDSSIIFEDMVSRVVKIDEVYVCAEFEQELTLKVPASISMELEFKISSTCVS